MHFSPSLVDAFFAAYPPNTNSSHLYHAAIGPTTRDRLLKMGVTAVVTAPEPSVNNVLSAIEEFERTIDPGM